MSVDFNDVVYYGKQEGFKNFIEDFCSLSCYRGRVINYHSPEDMSSPTTSSTCRKVALAFAQFFAAFTVIVPLIALGIRQYVRSQNPIPRVQASLTNSVSERRHSLPPITSSAQTTKPLPPRPLSHRTVSIKKPPSHCSRENVLEYHRHIASLPFATSSLMTWSRWADSQIRPSMKGLAKIGQSLLEKHHFPPDSLSVCPTLKNFAEELEKIQKNMDATGDFRRAFIVPTRSTAWGKNQQNIDLPRSETFAQHIVSVVLEKKGDKLHIAILDPMIRSGNQVIDPTNIGLEQALENTPFTEQELILSYIVSAGLNPETTTLYHSTVLREQSNGCWAFALKDAIAFLKSPEFFTKIELETGAALPIKGFQLKSINTLPIRFIFTAQWDRNKFNEYLRLHPEQDTSENRRKIEKYLIEDRNQRIGHAVMKWLYLLQFVHSSKNNNPH